MSQSSTSPEPPSVDSLLTMLEYALSSPDTKSQQKVYQQLTESEESTTFYTNLCLIITNPNLSIKIKEIAFLTLKSALQRNQLELEFNPQESQFIKNTIIMQNYQHSHLISNTHKSLISLLTLWKNNVDFEILNFILNKILSVNEQETFWGLDCLFIVFEDIRVEGENLVGLDTAEFGQFLQKYLQIFIQLSVKSNPEILHKSLKCMNQLLKYTLSLPETVNTLSYYLSTYLLPLFQSPPSISILETIIEGLTETIELNPQLILENSITLPIIVHYNPPVSFTQKYLTLVLTLIERDTEEKLQPFLSTIVPKILANLIFTKEDQLNLKLEMEEEANPYEYEQEEEEEFEEHSLEQGYTNRKVSVIIFEKLIVLYTEDIWTICEPYIKIGFSSENYIEKECATFITGIIFEKMEEHLEFLQSALEVIVAQIKTAQAPDILICTSLWTLAKLAYLVCREPELNLQVQVTILKCIQSNNEQIRNTAYSTLDEYICNSEHLLTPEVFPSIQEGIKQCTGKALYSVLKTICTLYEKHPNEIPINITQIIVKELCNKWAANSKIESIMSPILECLVTIASGNSQVFVEFAFEIFEESFKILENVNQKNVLLRSIDLLSTLVTLKEPRIEQTVSTNDIFHKKLITLISSDENEIKNFSYGLLGDICKQIPINKYAESYIQIIGKNINENNLTACSNAITCLTDLILANFNDFTKKYCADVMALAIRKIRVNNIHPVYGFNFARSFCRLCNVDPIEGSKFIKENLPRLCGFLKAHENQKLTDDSYRYKSVIFRGLFKIILLNPTEIFSVIQYLIESFICYPCEDQELQQIFVDLVKYFRKSITIEEWNVFLKNSLFLPAVAKKIETISK